PDGRPVDSNESSEVPGLGTRDSGLGTGETGDWGLERPTRASARSPARRRSPGAFPHRGAVLALLRTRAVVSLQVAEGVLHAGKHVLEHWLDCVDLLVMSEGHVEHPALSILLDPAQSEV